MLVRDILAKKRAGLVTVLPEATMRDAVQVMAAEKIGAILVVGSDGTLIGIFSERDLVRIIATNGAEARGFPIGTLASTSVITCTEENTLEDLIGLMSNNSIRHVPVLRDGKLAGMVSARDLMDAQKEDLLTMLARQQQVSELIAEAKNRAEQANRMKTEFLRCMSHELRSPLNVIIGFSDIIKTQKPGQAGDANFVSYAGEINMAGRHLLALIDDILSVTQLESGKREVREELLDPLAHAKACVNRFDAAAGEKDIALETRFPGESICLTGDTAMYDRMLDNLVSNALKFTPSGGRVTVEIGIDEYADLLVSVADTGVGISPDNLEAVLTPFSQVDGALDREFEGTGLGLALVKMMIEKHDGALELDSDLGIGTTVTLRFPADRVDAVGERQAAAR